MSKSIIVFLIVAVFLAALVASAENNKKKNNPVKKVVQKVVQLLQKATGPFAPPRTTVSLDDAFAALILHSLLKKMIRDKQETMADLFFNKLCKAHKGSEFCERPNSVFSPSKKGFRFK